MKPEPPAAQEEVLGKPIVLHRLETSNVARSSISAHTPVFPGASDEVHDSPKAKARLPNPKQPTHTAIKRRELTLYITDMLYVLYFHYNII